VLIEILLGVILSVPELVSVVQALPGADTDETRFVVEKMEIEIMTGRKITGI